MNFPRGFSGFFDPDHGPLPTTDFTQFKTICFAAARELKGKAHQFKEAGVTPNFHQGILEWAHGKEMSAVLCNKVHWIVAFSKPATDCRLTFIDKPELYGAFSRLTDWMILSKEELEKPLDESLLASMDPGDRKAIEIARRQKWFSPAMTVGDVLFHYWD